MGGERNSSSHYTISTTAHFCPRRAVNTPSRLFCRILQLQQGQVQIVRHCLGTSRYFQPVTMNSDSFRLYLQSQMKQAKDNTGMLRFDQDPVNCSGCLHLRAAVYEMGGQGVWKQGEGYFLCSATCPPFLQSVPFHKGI